MPTTRQILLVLALLPAAAGTQAAAPIAEFGPPLRILGCESGPDFNYFRTCVQNALQNRTQTAANDARAAMQNQVDALDTQLTAAETELQNVQSQLNGAMQQLQSPLVQAMSQMEAVELKACLDNQGIDLPQTMSQVMSNPTQFVQGRLTALWQQGMGAAAGMVQTNLQALQPGRRSPSINVLLDRTDALFTELAAQDPVAQCAWNAVAPFRSQARQVVAQIYPTIRDQYNAAISNTIQPLVDQAMMAVLQPMLVQMSAGADAARSTARVTARKAPRDAARIGGKAVRTGARMAAGAVPEDVRQIAMGIAHRYLLDPKQMTRVTASIHELTLALQNDPAGAPQAAENVQRALAPLRRFDEQIALDVAMDTIRFYGHSLIDTKGQEAVTMAFAGVQSAKDVVAEVVTGIVAVFYEPPSVVGEFIAGCVEVVVDNAVQPAAEGAMIRLAHQSFDTAVDQAHRALREQKPPSHYRQNAGPFGPLLAEFPTEGELIALAVPEVGTMRDLLFAYHASVVELGKVATLASHGRTAASTGPAPARR